MLTIIMAMLLGSLLPIQAKMSGEVFSKTQSASLSALIAVLGSLLLVTIIMLGERQPFYFPKTPWWAYLVGILGGFYIMGVSFMSSKYSITLVTVGILAGQMITALAVDYISLGHLELKKIGAVLLVSAAVMLSR